MPSELRNNSRAQFKTKAVYRCIFVCQVPQTKHTCHTSAHIRKTLAIPTPRAVFLLFNFAHTHSANGARLYHFLRRIASCLFIFRPLVLRTAPGGFGLSRCAQYGLRSVFLARQSALPYSEYLISFHFASAHVTPSSATVGVDVPPFFLLALSVSVHFSVGILLKE